MTDLEKTKHYTTEGSMICGNLVKYIPDDAVLIEPFVGDGDLLELFPNHQWETYDIEDKGSNVVQNTLVNPPDYRSKWVITNPPYLAQNKATDKEVFALYGVDDLYKATLKSIMDCEGGILIIPTNFFTDERTGVIRKEFLSRFEVKECNIFTQPVFKTTTYSVCSFAFKRSDKTLSQQNFVCNVKPAGNQIQVKISAAYDYRIGGEFYSKLKAIKPVVFNRLIGEKSDSFITHITLYAIDTRSARIHVAYEEKPFCGGVSDRTYATFVCNYQLSDAQQHYLIEQFNKELNEFRDAYGDLSLTNYRDYNRKRIGFTFAYQLMTKIYKEMPKDLL